MGVMTATALVGTGLSAYQTVKDSSDKRKAQKEMDNYERQELINPYKDIQLSTYGTDIMRDDAARDVASFTEAARNSGIRGIMGVLPKLQANSNKVNQQIGMNLERQDLERKRMQARGDERIMNYKENRDNQNISAISSQYNAANQDFNNGLWGVASGLTSAVRNTNFGQNTPQANSVNALSPQGISMNESYSQIKPVGLKF